MLPQSWWRVDVQEDDDLHDESHRTATSWTATRAQPRQRRVYLTKKTTNVVPFSQAARGKIAGRRNVEWVEVGGGEWK